MTEADLPKLTWRDRLAAIWAILRGRSVILGVRFDPDGWVRHKPTDRDLVIRSAVNVRVRCDDLSLVEFYRDGHPVRLPPGEDWIERDGVWEAVKK